MEMTGEEIATKVDQGQSFSRLIIHIILSLPIQPKQLIVPTLKTKTKTFILHDVSAATK
jgi:hypothetical protein